MNSRLLLLDDQDGMHSSVAPWAFINCRLTVPLCPSAPPSQAVERIRPVHPQLEAAVQHELAEGAVSDEGAWLRVLAQQLGAAVEGCHALPPSSSSYVAEGDNGPARHATAASVSVGMRSAFAAASDLVEKQCGAYPFRGPSFHRFVSCALRIEWATQQLGDDSAAEVDKPFYRAWVSLKPLLRAQVRSFACDEMRVYVWGLRFRLYGVVVFGCSPAGRCSVLSTMILGLGSGFRLRFTVPAYATSVSPFI